MSPPLPAALRVVTVFTVMSLIFAAAAPAQNAPKSKADADPIKEAPKPTPDVTAPRRESFELSVDQRDRFKKYLPKAFVKLSNREPLHLVTLGDSVVDMFIANDPEAGDYLRSYSAVFGKELARQFYYTGDLRVIRPNPKKMAKDRPYLGPEITFRSLGRGGKLMLHAMQALTTFGYESAPDIVLVSFGINDATNGVNPADYAKSLKQVIESVRSRGAEMILLGSTLTVEEPAEMSMGANRKYVDTMREIADANGIFFVDLGDLDSLVEVPATIQEPALLFDEVVKQYRRFFNQGEKEDFVHPLPQLQTLLGKRIFKELVDGPKPSPWIISGGKAVFDSAEKFTLSYQVKNTSREDERLATLPLIAGAWRPTDANPEVVIKKGETKTLSITYALSPGSQNARFNSMPSHEALLRLPIFFSGGGITRIEDLRAEIQPLIVLWDLESLHNQEKAFALQCSIKNTVAQPMKGAWVAEWMGQKGTGTFDLPPGELQGLNLSFNLPDSSAPQRSKGPLTLRVQITGIEMRFERNIEVARNIGLKQPTSLTPANSQDKSPSPDNARSGTPSVVLKADADKNSLYLTYEISGINLEDTPKGAGAFGWNLNLDARSYGKRLTFGSTDSLRLGTGMAADGEYPIVTPQPWAFGIGYAADYDPAEIKSTLSSSASGIRRYTIVIPKTFFYLHEWAIGNGNSQLGINTAIQFWQNGGNGIPPGYPDDRAFGLLTNERPRDDVGSLGVLELTDKPTSRWTVIPY